MSDVLTVLFSLTCKLKWQSNELNQHLCYLNDYYSATVYCYHPRIQQTHTILAVVTHINPLTPRVKPWVIQSFLTFDSMDRTLKCDHLFESC